MPEEVSETYDVVWYSDTEPEAEEGRTIEKQVINPVTLLAYDDSSLEARKLSLSNEAKTVEQSNQLYENIKKELNKKPENSINENNQMTVNGTQKLNEEKTYKSKDLLSTLDLIRRVEEI
jgi:hypothetical protein